MKLPTLSSDIPGCSPSEHGCFFGTAHPGTLSTWPRHPLPLAYVHKSGASPAGQTVLGPEQGDPQSGPHAVHAKL